MNLSLQVRVLRKKGRRGDSRLYSIVIRKNKGVGNKYEECPNTVRYPKWDVRIAYLTSVRSWMFVDQKCALSRFLD